MEDTVDYSYYVFNQNNSDGYFIIDDKIGIGSIVAIKAKDSKSAVAEFGRLGRAYEKKHGYGEFFKYCACCGKRWVSCEEDANFTVEDYNWSKYVAVHDITVGGIKKWQLKNITTRTINFLTSLITKTDSSSGRVY